MGILAGLIGWRGYAAAAAAALALGVGVTEVVEHKLDVTVPWAKWHVRGLGPQRDALYREIHNPKDGWILRFDALGANLKLWKVSQRKCVAARKADGERASHGVEAASSARTAADSLTYRNGYDAGRVAGKRSCTSATIADPATGPGGGPLPGVVRDPSEDFAERWLRGAYGFPTAMPSGAVGRLSVGTPAA